MGDLSRDKEFCSFQFVLKQDVWNDMLIQVLLYMVMKALSTGLQGRVLSVVLVCCGVQGVCFQFLGFLKLRYRTDLIPAPRIKNNSRCVFSHNSLSQLYPCRLLIFGNQPKLVHQNTMIILQRSWSSKNTQHIWKRTREGLTQTQS